jgi:hypothetical protein
MVPSAFVQDAVSKSPVCAWMPHAIHFNVSRRRPSAVGLPNDRFLFLTM